MSDPLQQVLAAEADALRRIDEARQELEAELRAARLDARRIKERNEQRTRRAVAAAEEKCAAQTEKAIDELNQAFSRQLTLDDESVEQRLADLTRRHVDQLWPE